MRTLAATCLLPGLLLVAGTASARPLRFGGGGELAAPPRLSLLATTLSPGLLGSTLPLPELPRPGQVRTQGLLAGVQLVPELHEQLAASAMQAAGFADAIEDGGGDSADRAIALILAFFPGFGIGHLISDDESGFLFYLVVDMVVIAAIIAIDIFIYTPSYVGAIWVLGWIGLHALQGYDAYKTAGGRRLAALPPSPGERVADALLVPGAERWRPQGSAQVLGFAF